MDQIANWWSDNPDANIGIATGARSNILVLDLDPRNGGSTTLKRVTRELGALPDTVTANTGGGGKHFVFEYPEFCVRKDSSGKLLGPGVDVLSDGGIMIVPPSLHSSRKTYLWAHNKSLSKLEPVGDLE